MVDGANTCPKCGHENHTSSPDCSKCGISFEIYRKEKSTDRVQNETRKAPEAGETVHKTNTLANCPNCSQPTDLSSEDCLKCGIIFSKYFEIRERDLENDPEKLKDLRTQKEAHESAVALRLTKEKEASAERRIKQQAEMEKAEAIKKQRAEQARLEALKKKQAEAEKQTALKKQQDEFERRQAILKQQAEQQEREALEKRQEEYDRSQAELKRQAEEHKREALKQLEKDYENADAEIKRQTELKIQEALEKQRVDLEHNQQREEVLNLMKNIPPQRNIQDRLKNYEGQTLGVNHDDPSLVDPAVLIRVGEDHFSILPPQGGGLQSYPFTAIASIVEEFTGISVGNADKKKTVCLVIKVYH